MIQLESRYSEHSTNHEQAYYGGRGRGRQYGGRFNSRGRGFIPATSQRYQVKNEQSRSHFDPKTSRGNTSFQGSQKDPQVMCQICGKQNHTALKCWNRFDHSFQPEDELPQAIAALAIKDEDDNALYADSRATTHILNNPGKVSKLKTYKGGDSLYVGNGDSLDITHIGEGDIYTENGKLKLKNILIVPEIKKNLQSIGQLTQDNACNIIFSTNNFVVKDLQGKVIAKGIKKRRIICLR